MPAKMKIRSAYATLPSAERKVADFILANPDRAPLMVINEIAAASGVSVPSVTRLAKKLGYDGFLDFRVALAAGTASIESIKTPPIKPTDNDSTVVDKVMLSTMRAIEDTLKATNKMKFSAIAELIATSGRRIFIFGNATSALLAEDIQYQLNYLGIDAQSVTQPQQMEMYKRLFKADDIFIGISRSGRTKLTLESLRAAKAAGAVTVFFTNFVNSGASNYTDYYFTCSRVDDVRNYVGRETIASILALTDALMTLVARKTPGYTPNKA